MFRFSWYAYCGDEVEPYAHAEADDEETRPYHAYERGVQVKIFRQAGAHAVYYSVGIAFVKWFLHDGPSLFCNL